MNNCLTKSTVTILFIVSFFIFGLKSIKATMLQPSDSKCRFDIDCIGFIEKDPPGKSVIIKPSKWEYYCANKDNEEKIIKANPSHLISKDNEILCNCNDGLCSKIENQNLSLIYRTKRFFLNLLTSIKLTVFKKDFLPSRGEFDF